MELLINLAGGVALMLWGIRMIRTGLTRAFGAELRTVLSASSGSSLSAFLAGMGVTALLQSSTATALIVSSFAARQVIAGSAALAIMLGADVGTTFVVQIFSQKVNWISPVLILVGVVTFMTVERNRPRRLARAFIGLGLLLLALKLIAGASEPIRNSGSLTFILEQISNEPALAILLAAVMTFLTHSSVAIVLLIASLVASGAVGGTLALTLVLGANLGGAFLPVLATIGGAPTARRAPLGNLLVRAIGVLACAPLVTLIEPELHALSGSTTQLVANFHTAFNLVIALAALPFVNIIQRTCERVLPERAAEDDPGRARHLDEGALDSPVVALTYASREALRLGDTVQEMLARTFDVLKTNDDELRREVEHLDDIVDRLHEAIKLYLTRLATEELDDEESNRSFEILSFTTNLEHIGDIIDKNLMELASKKIKSQAQFSDSGLAELEEFHARVVANLDLALNVFVSGDIGLARQLLVEKKEVRDLEMAFAEHHYGRIGEGRPESIDTSSLHLDVLRDLKRINGHLTSVAYPILERAGELAESRLKEHVRDDESEPGEAGLGTDPHAPSGGKPLTGFASSPLKGKEA